MNITDTLVGGLHDVLAGDEVVVRGSATKELVGIQLHIQHPTQRCLILPKRHDNIFAKIAETLWVLAGRNDIEWLSYYLPRAKEWADDGKHWRAGYGPRLRKWKYQIHDEINDDTYYIDQIYECYWQLKRDMYTRRAVMILFDPVADYCDSKDIPCNNWLHWLVRDGKLHLFIAQRSSDILWGFSGINAFEWSVLQEFMAFWLGIEPGNIVWNISSLHLYSQHYKRAESIVKHYTGETVYIHGIHSVPVDTAFGSLDNVLNAIFNDELVWRHGAGFYDIYGGGFLSACARMLHLYITDINSMDSQTPIERARHLSGLIAELPENTDFKLAAVEYFGRHAPELWDYVTLSDVELKALKAVGCYR